MSKVKKKYQQHGLSKHPLYRRYKKMMTRCYDPTYKDYDHYGGRGVKVCDEWVNDIHSFFEWALASGFDEKLELDKDIKGNGLLYCPEYCSWVTRLENMSTRSNSVFLEYDGEKLNVSEWSRRTGMACSTIQQRIKCGWSAKDILTKPLQPRTNRNAGLCT